MFRAKDADTVRALYHLACEMLGACSPRGGQGCSRTRRPDALAYLDFPASHWKRVRTNNVQERCNGR